MLDKKMLTVFYQTPTAFDKLVYVPGINLFTHNYNQETNYHTNRNYIVSLSVVSLLRLFALTLIL